MIYSKLVALLLFSGAMFLSIACSSHNAPSKGMPAGDQFRVAEVSPIAMAWAGHPTGPKFLTRGNQQFVVFYNPDRDMCVAMRTVDPQGNWSAWQVVKVPNDQPSPWGDRATSTRVEWDSHNYIAMAFDRAGNLHLSGNMHNKPLLYFRTTTPGVLSSLRRIDQMVGNNEDSVTYPRFVTSPQGELVFSYRQGHSGDGRTFYNIYDEKSASWRRLLDVPLFDGSAVEGVRSQTCNAYPMGPSAGPDGYYHVVWVWRDSGDASTNHLVSYARSKDLRVWEDGSGKTLKLPITPETTSVIVDPVPVNGGVINGCTKIGFDAQNQVVLTYHKFDKNGKTQIYTARWENNQWAIRQVSDWDFRWEFRGFSSLYFEVRTFPVEILPDGRLVQTWRHNETPGGVVLDPATLQPMGSYLEPESIPAHLKVLESKAQQMEVVLSEDIGNMTPARAMKDRWVLRFEVHRVNNDKPLNGPVPEPSQLRLYRIVHD